MSAILLLAQIRYGIEFDENSRTQHDIRNAAEKHTLKWCSEEER